MSLTNPEFDASEMERRITEKLKKEWEANQVKRDRDDLKRRLDEAEEYIKTLEEAIEVQKRDKLKMNGVHYGEIASVALEGFVRRNPALLAKIPGGEALAGLLTNDNEERQNNPADKTKDEAVSFSKAEGSIELSEEEGQVLEFWQQLQSDFSKEELYDMQTILGCISEDKTKLPIVLGLVQERKSN